ncbi:HalOD1 output domain-containing protein [Natrinema salinisoli]|uniref:HalOD1 output domain-containing protein n=1 Tax=Natrinema salinisoli TaxID=2878535 RepID=UPI001CF00683
MRGVPPDDGLDPSGLGSPLHEVIETDALDALVQSSNDSNATVEFAYRGTNVCVDDSDLPR